MQKWDVPYNYVTWAVKFRAGTYLESPAFDQNHAVTTTGKYKKFNIYCITVHTYQFMIFLQQSISHHSLT